MDKIQKTEKLVEKEVQSFLGNKPYWVWLVSYIGVVVLIVLAAYLVLAVLTLKWWLISLLVIGAGTAWATISYANKKDSVNNEQKK